MRSHTLTLALLAAILFIFSLYFSAQNFIFPARNVIPQHLHNIIKYSHENRWPEAEKSVNELVTMWNNHKYFLALNYAEADYSLFIDNVYKIQGAIQTRNDTEAISQSRSALKLWENFIKVFPEP